ncbi:MAG: SIR2 family protein [Planctomycetota bacterium]
MDKVTLERFYRTYLPAMRDQAAALFVGAGLSKASGFVDWKELLREIATDLGLDVEFETDLVALAQYHVNEARGRGDLNQLLVNEFTRNVELTENHHLIAQLPIAAVWTTNYDDLLEQAYRERQRRCDVKITKDNLAFTLPWRDVTLYKMHGDIHHPDGAVLTKEDYDNYNDKRQAFSSALQGDLVSKTFLFLGFSFEDPNIDYILARIWVLLGQNRRQHFCIMKEVKTPEGAIAEQQADYDYKKRKQALRIADLRRYGIETLLIDDYGQVTKILRELVRRANLTNVLISGSAHEYGAFGKDRLEALATAIAKKAIEKDMNLISGYGLGIGGCVIRGAMAAARNNNMPFSERLRLWPFPTGGARDPALWGKWREHMIDLAGFVIFLAGNKLENNNVVLATGVEEEFALTAAKGRYPIPVGATGYTAERIWKDVNSRLDKLYPGLAVQGPFRVLGNPNASTEAIVEAVFEIVRLAGGL